MRERREEEGMREAKERGKNMKEIYKDKGKREKVEKEIY